jgi:hypothetical protein
MDLTKTPNTLIAVACGVAFGALSLWFLQYALQVARDFDANPQRASFKHQIMRRKADAMDDALHAIVRGDLAKVNAAAVKMKEFASTIDNFLSTDVYRQYGDDFYRSIEDLKIATSENDEDGSKEAILRLEKSCIECHFLINRDKAPISTDPAK